MTAEYLFHNYVDGEDDEDDGCEEREEEEGEEEDNEVCLLYTSPSPRDS